MRYKYHEREIFWSGPDPVLIEEKKKKKKRDSKHKPGKSNILEVRSEL